MAEQMMLDKSELDNRLFEGFADTSRKNYVLIRNIDTGVSRWSLNAVEDFGLPDEYMHDAYEYMLERIHPEDRERFIDKGDNLFKNRETNWSGDFRVMNKAGE